MKKIKIKTAMGPEHSSHLWHYLDLGANHGNLGHPRLTIQDGFYSFFKKKNPPQISASKPTQITDQHRTGSHERDLNGVFVSYLYNWVVQVLLYRSRTVPLQQKERDPIPPAPTEPGTLSPTPPPPAKNVLFWQPNRCGAGINPRKAALQVNKPSTPTPPQNQHHFWKWKTHSILSPSFPPPAAGKKAPP